MVRWSRALLLVAALGTPAPVSALRVIDDDGRAVELAQPARRIVALAPHVTELLFAVGAGDRLVGVSEFSDYPEQAKSLPEVANGAGVDFERVVALAPDLVVVWRTGHGRRTLERVIALGFPVYVTESRRLADVPRVLLDLGRLAGTVETAAEVARRFETDLDALRERYRGRPPISVFYAISDRPLMSLNGEHMFSDVLGLCGARNVFDDMTVLAPVVGVEDVLARAPDVILLSSGIPDVAAVRDRWMTVGHTPAARTGNIYDVPADVLNRMTPRLVEAARTVCDILDRARAAGAG